MEKKCLKVGEKYLCISLMGGAIKVVAFPNRAKQSDKSPDYVGDGVAVWINKKQEEQPQNSFEGIKIEEA